MSVLNAKLASRRGMTLTELLAAVLILALVAAGTAAGVSASLRVCRQSTALSDALTLSSTLSIALMDELRRARDPGGSDTAVFTSSTFGPNVSVETNADGHVTVGGKELIGSGAYAGLTAEAGVYYDNGLFDVTIKVCRAGENGQPIRDVRFSVRPLNG